MEEMLSITSPQIQYLIKKDKRLAKVILAIGDLPYYSRENCFSNLVRTIINQMLSNKAAMVIYSRLESLCNNNVSPAIILKLSDEDMREIGISKAKVSFIKNLASEIALGSMDLKEISELDDEDVMVSLTSLKGFGTWSAKMYLIFTLRREDVLPYEDGAFLQSYRWLYKANNDSRADIVKRCKKWKPYSSIAARYLYIALDSGMTKREFHLYK